MMDTEHRRMMTCGDVCERLGICRASLQLLLAEGKIVGMKCRSRWRFDPEDVERYIEEQKVKNENIQ